MNAVMHVKALRARVRVPRGVHSSSVPPCAEAAECHDTKASGPDKKTRAIEIQSDHADS